MANNQTEVKPKWKYVYEIGLNLIQQSSRDRAGNKYLKRATRGAAQRLSVCEVVNAKNVYA